MMVLQQSSVRESLLWHLTTFDMPMWDFLTELCCNTIIIDLGNFDYPYLLIEQSIFESQIDCFIRVFCQQIHA